MARADLQECASFLSEQLQFIINSPDSRYAAYTKDIVRLLEASIQQLPRLHEKTDLTEMTLIGIQMHYAIRTFQIAFEDTVFDESVLNGIRKIIDIVDELDLITMKKRIFEMDPPV